MTTTLRWATTLLCYMWMFAEKKGKQKKRTKFTFAFMALLCARFFFVSGLWRKFHTHSASLRSSEKHNMRQKHFPDLDMCFPLWWINCSLIRSRSGICQCSTVTSYRGEIGIWQQQQQRGELNIITSNEYWMNFLAKLSLSRCGLVESRKNNEKKTLLPPAVLSLFGWNKFPHIQEQKNYFSPFSVLSSLFATKPHLGIVDVSCVLRPKLRRKRAELGLGNWEWSLTNIANATDKLVSLDFPLRSFFFCRV